MQYKKYGLVLLLSNLLVVTAWLCVRGVEIFLVILIAGNLAGIPGMILAIPGYTVLRVILREFFNKYKLVKSLTKSLEDEK